MWAKCRNLPRAIKLKLELNERRVAALKLDYLPVELFIGFLPNHFNVEYSLQFWVISLHHSRKILRRPEPLSKCHVQSSYVAHNNFGAEIGGQTHIVGGVSRLEAPRNSGFIVIPLT